MKYLFLTDLLLELTFINNLQVKIVMCDPEACVHKRDVLKLVKHARLGKAGCFLLTHVLLFLNPKNARSHM